MTMTTPAVAVQPETGGPQAREGAATAVTVQRPVPLKWIDAFETGSAEIDSLHRKLVQGCNSLLLLVENKAAWPLIMAEARKLVEDFSEHFRVEELLLERTGFPRRSAHAMEHRRMEQEMQRLIARMEQVDGSLKEHRDLPASLGPSLIDFIIRHDLDFRSHVLHLQGR